MSVKMVGAVIDCGPRDRTQFCVLMTLANNADDFGFAFPSLQTLAVNSRCDEKTVRIQINKLVTGGWLYVARKVLNGKCNVYMMNLEKIGVTAPTDVRRSPVFMRLLKISPGVMTPIFCSEKSPGKSEFSEGNHRVLTGHPDPTHRANRSKIAGIACPPNRINRHEPSHGTVISEPPPLPPQGGDEEIEISESRETRRGDPETKPAGRETELAAAELSPGAHDPDDRASRGASEHLEAAFTRFKTAVKREIGILTGVRNFAELVSGQSDYDTCFRHWWLDRLEREGTLFAFVTSAEDAAATKTGITKYRKRLESVLRAYFPIPKTATIEFRVFEQTAVADPPGEAVGVT